jgi:hypothetical protein
METTDFSRSFLKFSVDVQKKPPETVSHKPLFTLNNVRIPLECRLQIAAKQMDYREEFVLTASCKTERVNVDHDIWTSPNADVFFVFSASRFLIVKTYDYVGRQVPLYPPSLGMQPERHAGLVQNAFDAVRIDIAVAEAEPLASTARIIDGALSSQPLVAATEIENDRYIARIEYPVKVINASERDGFFQTDTGPVLLPDLSREPEDMLEGLELAYSAFNSPDWIELIVRHTTPIGNGISVWHYSRPERFESKNSITAVKE